MDSGIVFRVKFNKRLNEAEIDHLLSKFMMEFVEPKELRYGGGIQEEKIEGAISKDLTNELKMETVGADLSVFFGQVSFVRSIEWHLYSEVNDSEWFGDHLGDEWG